jgi:lauroyl/myristoyl acyltransferase
MPVRLSWKTLFYDGVLPRLDRLDNAAADRRLAQLGALVQRVWGPRRRVVARAVKRATRVLALEPHQARAFRVALGHNTARMLARDFLLDDRTDREVDQRFHTEGFEHVVDALAQGDGLIVLGSHMGAYVPALHWLYRQDLPLRAMIQRPRHVSRYLQAQLDRAAEPFPSTRLFLRRDLSHRDAAERLLRARAALREGLPLYLCGDITVPGGYPVSWFGQPAYLLDHWSHLAASTGACVVPLFASFAPEGTYRIRFEPAFRVSTQSMGEPIQTYLRSLERVVANDPAQAVPYWTWPSYAVPTSPTGNRPRRTPEHTSRRDKPAGPHRSPTAPQRENQTVR